MAAGGRRGRSRRGGGAGVPPDGRGVVLDRADPRTDTAAVVTPLAWATHSCPGQSSKSPDHMPTICGTTVTMLGRMEEDCCYFGTSSRARRQLC